MDLSDALRRDLTAAMRSKDRVAVRALRSLLSALGNAEAVPTTGPETGGGSEHVAGGVAGLGAGEAERRRLTDDDVAALVRQEVEERLSAADQLDAAGRSDRAEPLRAEAAVLARYLPG
jgi:uncharacterized protein YqeY